MKIAIDARWIFPEISGIGEYTRELIRELLRQDRANTYMLLFNDPAVMARTLVETGAAEAPNVQPKPVGYGVFSLRSQLLLPMLLRHLKVDVYHSTNYMIPFRAFSARPNRPMKCVVTIHDVIPLLFPGCAPRSKKTRLFWLYRQVMRQVGRRADVIVSDSEASRQDVAKQLGIPPDDAARTKTVYCGVSPRFTPPARTAEKASDSKEPRTLLYVGRMDPYKNVAALICALSIARKKVPFPLRLVIAGSHDARYPEPSRLAEELGVSDWVEWTGYLSDEELVARYHSADVLVHASRYEGFGLQVVEAMACGLPVICSDGGSLPEVAGDAAIVLRPDDVTGFAGRIVEVLTHPALAREMAGKGQARAAQFTWARTAAGMLETYRQVAGA